MNSYDELTISARPENLEQALFFIEEHLKNSPCPPKVQMQIRLAAEEIFVNIASYAYAPQTGPATLRVSRGSHDISVTFIDHGIPYDPLLKEDPDVSLSSETRPIGGLGIYLIKNMADDIRYEYENGCNKLTIRKTWAPEERPRRSQ